MKNKATSIQPDVFLTRQQLAKKLNCCLRTVDNLKSSRSIEVVKVGRSVRFKPESVVKFIESYTINSAA